MEDVDEEDPCYCKNYTSVLRNVEREYDDALNAKLRQKGRLVKQEFVRGLDWTEDDFQNVSRAARVFCREFTDKTRAGFVAAGDIHGLRLTKQYLKQAVEVCTGTEADLRVWHLN